MAGHYVGLMRATTDESSPDIPSSCNRMFNTIFAEKFFKNVFLGKKLMFVYSKSEEN